MLHFLSHLSKISGLNWLSPLLVTTTTENIQAVHLPLPHLRNFVLSTFRRGQRRRVSATIAIIKGMNDMRVIGTVMTAKNTFATMGKQMTATCCIIKVLFFHHLEFFFFFILCRLEGTPPFVEGPLSRYNTA